MRFTIIYNPRSGRAKASQLADAIANHARTRGHQIQAIPIDPKTPITNEQIQDCDRLVIVGGDGTVHHLLGQLRDTQTPFYHCGTGTANLICHAFNMNRKPAGVLVQLETDTPPLRVDLPTCNGHPFLIMTSIGMDASVIHRLEETRKLGGYRAYALPTLREVLKPRIARVHTTLDGTAHAELSGRGVLVIANMPNYGGHFDPCHGADCTDAQLDVARIPGTTSITAGLRYLALRLRLPIAPRGTAQHIEITSEAISYVQIDGEKPTAVPNILNPGDRLHFAVGQQSVRLHAPKRPQWTPMTE